MDHELIDKLAMRARETGSDMDFEALYREMRPVLRGLSKRWLFIRGVERADLEQEFSMIMIYTLPTWDPGRVPYERYFSMACHNRVITILRHSLNQKSHPLNSAVSIQNLLPGGDGHEIQAPGPCPGPSELMEIGELLDLFLGLALTRIELRCMVLWSMGHGDTEISEMLGCPYKRVDNALSRARGKFEKMRARKFDPGLPMDEAIMGWIDGL